MPSRENARFHHWQVAPRSRPPIPKGRPETVSRSIDASLQHSIVETKSCFTEQTIREAVDFDERWRFDDLASDERHPGPARTAEIRGAKEQALPRSGRRHPEGAKPEAGAEAASKRSGRRRPVKHPRGVEQRSPSSGPLGAATPAGLPSAATARSACSASCRAARSSLYTHLKAIARLK